MGERPVRGETILATAENIAHALAHTHKHRHPALPPCCREQSPIVSLKAFVNHTPASKGPVSAHRSHCLPGQSACNPFLMERRNNTPLCAPSNVHLIKGKLCPVGGWPRLCSETHCPDPFQEAGPSLSFPMWQAG